MNLCSFTLLAIPLLVDNVPTFIPIRTPENQQVIQKNALQAAFKPPPPPDFSHQSNPNGMLGVGCRDTQSIPFGPCITTSFRSGLRFITSLMSPKRTSDLGQDVRIKTAGIYGNIIPKKWQHVKTLIEPHEAEFFYCSIPKFWSIPINMVLVGIEP